ncbi:hypothetical protein [Effusibacillus consociatus]|uniref:Uncharacterized protein n=1 Tax=Effusibacillus consociatus TaxID=1117041 RepID=A0ABV9Q4B2_9BACL
MRATELMREKLLRTIMLRWILEDAKEIKQTLPRGEMWTKGLLQPLHEKLTNEMVEIKRALNSNAFFIVEEEWRPLDVYIKYKENGYEREVVFMMAMLEAEAQGRLEHMAKLL